MNEESNNKEREKISAYLDDDLSQSELGALDDISSRQRGGLGIVSRYQLIGDVLRGQLGDASMVDVHLQVREALRDEEIRQEKQVDNKVVDRGNSIFDLAFSWLNPAWYRPAAGLAVAASVAMVMVNTVSHEEMVSDINQVAENAMTDNVPVISMPVATSVATFTADRNGTASKLVDQRLIDQHLSDRSQSHVDTSDISWHVTKLPSGFALKQSSKRKAQDAEMQHLVYSDGQASVSVFIERGRESHHRLIGASNMGALNAFGTRSGEYFITVMGEVPASSVIQIAQSTKPKNN